MGHTGVGLILCALLQPRVAAPEDLAHRWLVLGKTHATREAAEAHAAEVRKRDTEVQVLSTDHYTNMLPGRFAIVFFAVADKAEAKARQRGIWNLGHHPWIRWSGDYIARPTRKSLRLRKEKLSAPKPPEAVK